MFFFFLVRQMKQYWWHNTNRFIRTLGMLELSNGYALHIPTVSRTSSSLSYSSPTLPAWTQLTSSDIVGYILCFGSKGFLLLFSLGKIRFLCKWHWTSVDGVAFVFLLLSIIYDHRLYTSSAYTIYIIVFKVLLLVRWINVVLFYLFRFSLLFM